MKIKMIQPQPRAAETGERRAREPDQNSEATPASARRRHLPTTNNQQPRELSAAIEGGGAGRRPSPTPHPPPPARPARASWEKAEENKIKTRGARGERKRRKKGENVCAEKSKKRAMTTGAHAPTLASPLARCPVRPGSAGQFFRDFHFGP